MVVIGVVVVVVGSGVVEDVVGGLHGVSTRDITESMPGKTEFTSCVVDGS